MTVPLAPGSIGSLVQVTSVQPQEVMTAKIVIGASEVLLRVKVQERGPALSLTVPKSCVVLSKVKGPERANASKNVIILFIEGQS